MVDCSRVIAGRFWNDGSEEELSREVKDDRKDVLALGRRAGFRDAA